jgi:fumarate reductase iron-sulfur subunit
MGRTLTLNIFRYNPQDTESQPHMQAYQIEETQSMTLFIALNQIREEQDPSLQFEFCCRAAICGACAMVINGRPELACHTMTEKIKNPNITLLPLPYFKLIGDLTVDTGQWFRDLNTKIGSWIHTDTEFDPNKPEDRMDNELAEEIYELERCVECGCCVAACGTARMRDDFMGAVALNRIARFILDPRDQRSKKEYFEIVGSDEGIFGCMGLLGCEDVCPKNIPLQDQLGMLRRRMAFMALKNSVFK